LSRYFAAARFDSDSASAERPSGSIDLFAARIHDGLGSDCQHNWHIIIFIFPDLHGMYDDYNGPARNAWYNGKIGPPVKQLRS
jgi:hypothetical protein